MLHAKGPMARDRAGPKDKKERLAWLMREMAEGDPVELLGMAVGAFRTQRPRHPATVILDALFLAAARDDLEALDKKGGPGPWARAYTRKEPMLFSALTERFSVALRGLAVAGLLYRVLEQPDRNASARRTLDQRTPLA